MELSDLCCMGVEKCNQCSVISVHNNIVHNMHIICVSASTAEVVRRDLEILKPAVDNNAGTKPVCKYLV